MLQIKLKVSTSVWQLASLSDHHHQPFTDLPLHLHAQHFQLTIANPWAVVAVQKLLFNFFANSLNLCSTKEAEKAELSNVVHRPLFINYMGLTGWLVG